MFSLVKNGLMHIPSLLKQPVFSQCFKLYHILSKPAIPYLNSCIVSQLNPQLLKPLTPNVNLSCGFKVKGHLKRRCKDCYFVVRQQRLFVICKTHPRHKQMSMVSKEKNTWNLTHATMGKVRPW